MIFFILGLLILITVISLVQNYQLKKAFGKLENLRAESSTLQQTLANNQATRDNIIKDVELLQKQQSDCQQDLLVLTTKRNELKDVIEEHQALIANQNNILASYETQYETIKKNQNERCLRAAAEASQKIEEIENNCKLTIEQKELETKTIIQNFSNQIENERQKYLSIIETIQNAETEDEKNIHRHIKLREAAQEDINYLLNNVVNRLSNPDILYKLIWSEYIQKPTNEMLDFILPQRDCSGIYKITNDKTKRAYIGRSTSVRKRLTDHIKSAIGISTIADQQIHKAMREEGLWNFTFELIEACDKASLGEHEKYYIEFFKTQTWGYNAIGGSAFKGE